MDSPQSGKRKPMSNRVKFKINEVEYTIENNNCRAAEHFGVFSNPSYCISTQTLS